MARENAASGQGKLRSAAHTCLLPGPTSKRPEQYLPIEILVTQGIHRPPGPSTAFPTRTFTDPGGGLDSMTDASRSWARFIVASLHLKVWPRKFD